MVVEPCHPFQRRQLYGLLGFPWRSPVDEFGFVEAKNGVRFEWHLLKRSIPVKFVASG